jgi:hypothetical protein
MSPAQITTLTIVSCDQVTFHIDKSLLSLHSIVFKDMLDLPQISEGGNDLVDVTESGEIVELMLKGFKGDINFRTLTWKEVGRLVILSDKYESAFLKVIVSAHLG